jgi:hypothetical protein
VLVLVLQLPQANPVKIGSTGIFAAFWRNEVKMKPTKLSRDQIQNTIKNAITEAVDFIESEIAPQRIKAQKYFSGEVDLPVDDGRSSVVATKCRDTVRAVKPSLMRVFLQSGRPVEFIPRKPQAVQEAEQKTNYASYVFERNNGFQILSDAVDDALKKKVGIWKVYIDEPATVEIDEYSDLIEDQVQMLRMDPEIEILEEEVTQEATIDEMGITIMPAMYDLKIAKETRSKEIRIDAVAPEDFFVDRNASGILDAYVCGHSAEMRVGDVVAMGFDFETVYNMAGTTDGRVDEEEELQRLGWDASDTDEDANDPSMRKITLTEAYMKMDIEGTGIPRLYKFLCGGGSYELLEYELCDQMPFAVFEVDPEAHAFFGRSLVEIIMDDQDAATALLRGLLDNMSLINNPRLVVNSQLVNMDDVLNNEIGAIIRTKDVNAVREITIGGMATGLLPAITYYDEAIRAKTGVSGAGMGLDANVLQSQTAQGVNAAVQAANQVSELIARHLAEGGLKQAFKIIAKLAKQHIGANEMMRVNGEFIPVDPRSWSADSDLTVNVGLGTGKHEERAMVLRETLQTQMGIWQSYGPQNGVVTMTNIRNTMADILRHSGMHNAERYYQPMNQQMEKQLMMQAAQAAQGQQQQPSDPNAAFLQAEQMKTSARVQADMQRTQMDFVKAQMQDDRERDKMIQDLEIEAAKILANSGIRLNEQQIRAQQAMTQPMGMPGMLPNA